MPRSINEVLAGAELPDVFTDEDVDDLQQEIVRDVTAVLMFGGTPAPAGHFPTLHEQADKRLAALSAQLLHHRDAAEHITQLVNEGIDADGALRFGCLLNLADEPGSARFWWQFSAGIGNSTAAYCLHLYHLARGELRDADHWALQAAALADGRAIPRTLTPRRPPHRPTAALRAAVRKLPVEEFGLGPVLHPAPHLAEQIEELADAL
ncbi:hypothetical protein SUDANB58_05758 (plasmid) [Streptomyces sp. enrichment culture]|uniref:hypothetical protein n=1 Tax=Streptomyces sp. enrichment culture TaxID=1795815 RepID=UPI003F57B04B